jgi:hypothetical protein
VAYLPPPSGEERLLLSVFPYRSSILSVSGLALLLVC